MLFRTFAGALSVIESRAIVTVMDIRCFAVFLCAGLVIAGCESDPSESVASASASEADFSTVCAETVTASGNDRMAGLCPCLTDKVKKGADKEEITKVLKSSPQSMRQTMGDLTEATRNTIRGCMREAFAGGRRGGPPGAGRPSGGDSAISASKGDPSSSASTGGDRERGSSTAASNPAASSQRGGGSRSGGGGFQSRPVPVAVTLVERGRVDAFYATTTTLTSQEEAVVVARTQGVVEEIFSEEGDQVKRGAALAQLDTRKLELEVRRTRTNIESFERAFARSQQLLETNMISPEAHDQARYNLEREKASLALQIYDLAEATIRAPIDGVITKREIKLGNTLSPNSPAFEIKRVDAIEAILNVPEREVNKVKRGQLARVTVDALSSTEFDGIVDRVAPEIDANSGTFRVTVRMDNQKSLLRPGMFARVGVRYDSNENTLLLKREAVVTQKDESSVFVVRDGVATKQEVKLGYAMGSDIEILDGLVEGDEVVVTGQGGLRDGSSVRVVKL
ncbi:MAG: efflux RND transporter periplasmic adaptor subunit [Pseudomonadota bacterium]|nr:efflux RND transporter periplasmic adaptor subunit [Pseudomonadota bacterium]